MTSFPVQPAPGGAYPPRGWREPCAVRALRLLPSGAAAPGPRQNRVWARADPAVSPDLASCPVGLWPPLSVPPVSRWALTPSPSSQGPPCLPRHRHTLQGPGRRNGADAGAGRKDRRGPPGAARPQQELRRPRGRGRARREPGRAQRRGEASARGRGCGGSAPPPGSEVTADRPAAGSTRETAPPGGRVILTPLHSLCDGALVSAGL